MTALDGLWGASVLAINLDPVGHDLMLALEITRRGRTEHFDSGVPACS